MSSSKQTVTMHRAGPVAVIRIDHPPVNAIGKAVRDGLAAVLDQVVADEGVGAVLITTAGKIFMAGADINDFDGPMEGASLASIAERIEALDVPAVAAIQGLALGGGLELAMACHYRVAAPAAKLGLPEITLGIIPGAGGTQRLPRLVGAPAALDLIVSGAPVSAAEALRLGLIDAVIDDDPHAAALDYCERLIASGAGPRRTCEQALAGSGLDDDAVAAVLAKHARALKGRATQTFVVAAIEAAAAGDFAAGLRVEADLARASLKTRESQALRHLFLAERQAGKVPGLSRDAPAAIARAAVVGAGTMGSGIAMAFADAGVNVILIDNDEAGIARGRRAIESVYAASVKRGRLTQAQADDRIAAIATSVELDDVATADVVIEAVFEDLNIKKALLARLDELLPPAVLIGTNTSTLSVTELAGATRNPGRVAGLHFFSPAHVMKLLEIVRGADTDPEALARALQVARVLKKIGVVARDGFGFIGNKMMLDGFWRESEQLMLEGASPAQVDRALEAFGFAMGPQRVSDLGGTDVGTKARIQLYRRETRPDPYFVIADRLTELDRLGQKTGAGFYRYEPGGRDAIEGPAVTEIAEALAAERGIRRRTDIGDEEILDRCLLALINVGAEVLGDGIAARASDIDVAWTAGYGFPRHLGGPMFHADTIGLPEVARRIRRHHEQAGHYWRPAPLLEALAAGNGSFAAYDRSRA